MTEQYRQSPQEAVPPQELHFGEEFSLFDLIELPSIVTEEMMYSDWENMESHNWKETPHDYLPQFRFSIDGINGCIVLFENPYPKGANLPFGEVRKDVSEITSSTEGKAGETKKITTSVPLGFGVLMEALSKEMLEKIKKMQLNIKIKDVECKLFFSDDVAGYGKDVVDEIFIEDDKFNVWMTSDRISVEGSNENIRVALPYKKDVLDTIKATFMQAENPEA